MLPIFKKLIKSKNNDREELFDGVRQISILSDEIAGKKKSLEKVEYEMLTKHQNDVYLSLADFLEFVDDSNISISDIISKCKHVSELQGDVSTVDVYSIVDGSHIVLCKDVHSCEDHKDYNGDKIRILTVRRVT